MKLSVSRHGLLVVASVLLFAQGAQAQSVPLAYTPSSVQVLTGAKTVIQATLVPNYVWPDQSKITNHMYGLSPSLSTQARSASIAAASGQQALPYDSTYSLRSVGNYLYTSSFHSNSGKLCVYMRASAGHYSAVVNVENNYDPNSEVNFPQNGGTYQHCWPQSATPSNLYNNFIINFVGGSGTAGGNVTFTS